MIVTELYKGQGLGNQLWSYVVTRAIAKKNGFAYGIMNHHNFKGADFLELDFGEAVLGGASPEGGPPTSLPIGIIHYYREIKKTFAGIDITGDDKNLFLIQDQTKIDGVFQSEKYIEEFKSIIPNWINFKKELEVYDFSSNDICVLNIRGGEYLTSRDLLLPKSYWISAMSKMKSENSAIKFIAVTDDVSYVNEMLPGIEIFHKGIASDYSVIKNAKNLILSNSSFAFFPVWVGSEGKNVLAPKYWARYNISNGFWSSEKNLYKEWKWLDRNSKIFTYEQCRAELERYYSKPIRNFYVDYLLIYLNKIINRFSSGKK